MDINEQVAWERECQKRGSLRYTESQDKLRDSGQGDTTQAMSYIMRDRLIIAGKYLKQIALRKQTGVSSHYNKILRVVAQDDYMKITFIGLKCILRAVSMPAKNTLLRVVLDIASRIESELKCQLFEAEYPEYFNEVQKSFKTQKITDFTHKHKVMMKKFADFDLEWSDWSTSEKVHIGTRVLRAVLIPFSDLIYVKSEAQNNKTQYKVNTTVAFDDWIEEFERVRGLLNPMYLPLKIPPRPWDSFKNGGYYTPNLRLPFIKTKSKDHKEFVSNNMPDEHLKAVNKMQDTTWQINREVLQVQQEVYARGLGIGIPNNKPVEVPPFPTHLAKDKQDYSDKDKEDLRSWKMMAKTAHGEEKKRKARVLAFMQGHKLAKELLSWEELYFVYTCDFRGRIYCATSGLSPQGADSAKGLLRFKKGVRLGKDGVKWLATQGANCFGVDKVSYADRIKWVQEHEIYIKQVVDDPINARDFWGSADKPYQFLAFCFEWGRCDYGRDTTALSYIPVGLDGSCNGLQHFSAMLRDEIGARATNLLPCDKPEDIYQEVADVAIKKLSYRDDPLAAKWIKVGVTRKCSKRPVMTVPYGAKQSSTRTYIYEYADDNWPKFELAEEHKWEFANYLTPVLWESISEVVIAARAGMDWLQKCKVTDYIKWLSPIGFPVYQYYKDVKSVNVETQLSGKIRLSISDLNKEGTPKKSAQKAGVAPNFVHSIDSTHMVMTINMSDDIDLAMIHDDYGTHAGNTQHLFDTIRTSFHKLYTEHNPLEEWAEQVDADISKIPSYGNYDINQILKADYFFG